MNCSALLALVPSLLLTATCAEPLGSPDEVPVQVGRVVLDQRNLPVVILEEQNGPRWLPIWIGPAEARSIAIEMEDQTSPRPNTHDLAKRVIDGLHGEVVRVVVTELRNATYFATLALRVRGDVVVIDSRPSDAIAIALRVEAPIFVRAPLFEAVKKSVEVGESGQQI